jgi:NAD+ synthase
MLSIRTDYKTIYTNIRSAAREYLEKNTALRSLIVGLSGGIDSALICVIASELVKELPDIRLIGRSIPIESNTDHEILRAKNIGENFCTHFKQEDLTQVFQNFHKDLMSLNVREKAGSYEDKIRRGNIKARLRMIYLFDLAHYENGMVLSTDNYTELLLGFWTLHGDVGNYGFIQYLWKTEVYGLAQFLVDKYRNENETSKAEALQACIDAVPTDGLGITISDFDQIGVSDYMTVDNILINYPKGGEENTDHPVIQRHLRSEFKRRDPQNIGREALIQGFSS